jgi:hypothetical protein
MSRGPITQAERNAMVKRFERSTQCRLSPKALLEDQWHHSSIVIYDEEYARLVEMIRGQPEAKPVCPYCKNSPFGMDVDRCPVHGEGCA